MAAGSAGTRMRNVHRVVEGEVEEVALRRGAIALAGIAAHFLAHGTVSV
ncbi:MAG: hypothetical protein Greene041662_212 [Candidatus Peregrinibacteria bacterium Greene0416_62]|nr:MAG: hypothetical protein Greene041662_212 [Candidatus Peregrinibacteria bacterium Greene0416_62]TSC99567.1 MAG: hypothetical protein Greene101449_602 [Candidatus Peregrinibacteria bacterium Greene1014_49]